MPGRLAPRSVLLAALLTAAAAAAAPSSIDGLRNESPAQAPRVETLPEQRGGQDVVGTKLPTLEFDGWIPGAEGAARPRAGQPVLYRWWTDTCPYCKASLPGFEVLRKRYEPQGLAVVGVYHPKPPRRVSRADVRRDAHRLGFRGRLALDEDWSELRRAYLDAHPRRATSISLLVDGKGVVRFVHPGPVLFPSDDPAHAREHADFTLLDRAVQSVLAEAARD
jgi:thiol-disulfide isomerase/thioredoxin